ncbi:flagellar motor switch protein FliM [Leptospirillum ferriphilum]|uniref:flagellar motor switch protein FliM n=1 Tax=Leptospirillum ferriphilum TaxID=178606 RepID=UPI0006B21E38|nr:flagellar motor switch protein FliM [Leptospirillum ferriphilum]
MAQFLSQDEVNALLRGVVNGEIDVQSQTPEEIKGARPYSLASQERVIRGRMPTLEIINERFSRFFQVSFSASLRKMVEFSSLGIEMVKFGDFLKKIPLPSNINILRLEDLRKNFLLIIDARLLYLLVDHVLGGSGRGQVKVEGRDFSPIEARISRNVVDQLSGDFEKAWAPVHPMPVTYIRSEINPQFVPIVAPTEMVIVMSYMLEIEGQGRPLYICIPYSAIEPIKEKLYTGFQSDQFEIDTRWIHRLEERIAEVPLELEVYLGQTVFTIREILDWQIGTVFSLDRYPSEPVDIRVEGVLRFRGRPGLFRNNRAIRIECRVPPPTSFEEEEPNTP